MMTRRRRDTRSRPFPSAAAFLTNLIWTGLESNSGIGRGRTATNRLSDDTALVHLPSRSVGRMAFNLEVRSL
jgi:hypothetical protein